MRCLLFCSADQPQLLIQRHCSDMKPFFTQPLGQQRQIFFIGLPVLFLLLGAYAMKDYDLSPEKHRRILDELMQRDVL